MTQPSDGSLNCCGRVFKAGLTSLFGLVVIVCTACGVTFSEGEPETEIFKRLVITGSLTPDQELTMVLEYEQPYAATVNVQCDVLILAEATETREQPGTIEPPGEGATPSPTPIEIPATQPTPTLRLGVILVEPIGPNSAGTTVDESTPTRGSITRKFMGPKAGGDYTARCYTPDDENNQIFEDFHIEDE
jgi:hypothetical protein